MAIHTCLVTYIYLVTYICPTKFSDVGFCPTKFKLCPTKIKSDRTNVLSNIYLQPCSGPRSLVALTVALISGPHYYPEDCPTTQETTGEDTGTSSICS